MRSEGTGCDTSLNPSGLGRHDVPRRLRTPQQQRRRYSFRCAPTRGEAPCATLLPPLQRHPFHLRSPVAVARSPNPRTLDCADLLWGWMNGHVVAAGFSFGAQQPATPAPAFGQAHAGLGNPTYAAVAGSFGAQVEPRPFAQRSSALSCPLPNRLNPVAERTCSAGCWRCSSPCTQLQLRCFAAWSHHQRSVSSSAPCAHGPPASTTTPATGCVWRQRGGAARQCIHFRGRWQQRSRPRRVRGHRDARTAQLRLLLRPKPGASIAQRGGSRPQHGLFIRPRQ